MPKQKTRFSYDHPHIPYAVEFDIMDDADFTKELDDFVEAFYPSVIEGDQRLIEPLKQLIKKYPHVPQLKNYLYIVYMMGGKLREGDALLRETREKHPRYLFGLTNAATRHIEKKGDTAAARRLLGESLWLHDLYPETKVFHYTEVLNYYQAAIILLLEEGEIAAAKERHEILLEIDPDHSIVEKLTKAIALKDVIALFSKLKHWAETSRKVKARTTARYLSSKEPTVIHHAEIQVFYSYCLEDISAAELEAIIALPRATLAQDLCRVLEDCLRRYSYFKKEAKEWEEWQAEQLSFASHAFRFLGVLGYEEALPIVLDFFRQTDEFFDFWLGDSSTELTVPYLTRIAGQNLPALQQFMRERYVGIFPKLAVQKAVAQLAWNDPARLPEVQAWFASLFEFYADNLKDKGLIDSDLIGWIAASAGELRLRELLPLIKPFYEQQIASENIMGDWEKVVAFFDEPWDESHRDPLPENILEAYEGTHLARRAVSPRASEFSEKLEQAEKNPHKRSLLNLLANQLDMKAEHEEVDLSPEQPLTAAKPTTAQRQKVGRNAPCPCGSGRKHKHCCGKK